MRADGEPNVKRLGHFHPHPTAGKLKVFALAGDPEVEVVAALRQP